MIKTRVRKWGLDKKHKQSDMRTAVALIAHDRARWAVHHPRFRIRGQEVTYTDILNYFKRKQISDPIAWVIAAAGDGFVASPDVELLDTASSGSVENSESADTAETRDGTASITRPAQQEATPKLAEFSNWQPEPSKSAEIALRRPILGSSIIHPHTHLAGDRVTWVMRDYITSYLESPRARTHKEPTLHRFTLHANFAQRMQSGIFLSKKNEMVKAFGSFKGGFDMIQEMLKNDHPMAISMLMSVICELNKNGLEDVVLQLTSLAKQMADIQNKESYQLRSMFEVLDRAGKDAANLAICSMRVAIDYLSEKKNGPHDWKVLYLKERLCDCLYYLGMSGEGAALRSRLLKEQEQKYGTHARNVLWTLTNVADDDLQRGDFVNAERRFNDALRRSNELEGYEKGNGRFKALEGLAKTAIATADMPVFKNGSIRQDKAIVRRRKLSDALQYLNQAEMEATTWFDGPRRIRVTEKKLTVKAELDLARSGVKTQVFLKREREEDHHDLTCTSPSGKRRVTDSSWF